MTASSVRPGHMVRWLFFVALTRISWGDRIIFDGGIGLSPALLTCGSHCWLGGVSDEASDGVACTTTPLVHRLGLNLSLII